MRGATPRKAEPALVVFARAPEPGRAKTRLAPLLGKRGAARLQERMIQRTLRTAMESRLGPVFLYCSPAVKNKFFEKKQKQFALQLRSQGRGSLGARMHRAFSHVLKEHEGAILVGSDCPVLAPADLRAAARSLRAGSDAAVSPAEDGGYALIALRRNSRRLFQGIDWGGPQVFAQTRRRLARLGWRWKRLRTVWDVDRPEDVARLRRERLL